MDIDHGFAADLPCFLHYRRSTAKRRRETPVLRGFTCAFTVGSSSPLRGVATGEAERVPLRDQPGPHHPYEGSQPLRGVATRASTPDRTRRAARPHHPYEGSQPSLYRDVTDPDVTSPHHPYEGSQHGLDDVFGRADRKSSSPLRGVATARSRSRPAPESRVLITPTRGRNRSARASESAPAPSSSPLRGVATPPTRRHRATAPRCPHHPYEGSQHGVVRVADDQAVVLITPTRGRNP